MTSPALSATSSCPHDTGFALDVVAAAFDEAVGVQKDDLAGVEVFIADIDAAGFGEADPAAWNGEVGLSFLRTSSACELPTVAIDGALRVSRPSCSTPSSAQVPLPGRSLRHGRWATA